MKNLKITDVIKKIKYDLLIYLFGFFLVFILKLKGIFEYSFINHGTIDLITFSLPILSALIPVIVAISILIYQLYYNRYILKELKKSINVDLFVLFFILVNSILFNFLFWAAGEDSFFLYLINIYILFYLIIRVFIFIFYYNKISIQFYIDKIYKQTIKEIELNSIKKEKIIQAINNLDEYFIESIEKTENVYIKAVIETKEKIFYSYIENRDKLINNTKFDDSELKKIDRKFINSIIKDFKNITDSNLNSIIINRFNAYLFKILKTCIDCEKESIYSNLNDELFILLCKNKVNDKLFSNTNTILKKVYIFVINNLSDLKWEKQIEDLYSKLFVCSELIIEDNNKLKEILIIVFNMLSIKLKKRNFDDYSTLFKIKIKEIGLLAKTFSKIESEYLFISFSQHFHIITEERSQEAYNLFISCLFDLIRKSIFAKNKNLVLEIGFLISEVLSENNNFIKSKDILEIRNECILKCIDLYPDVSIAYFPNYKSEISKNRTDIYYIENLSNFIMEILFKVIRINDNTPLYFYIDSLNDCIGIFEQKEKEQLKLLFKVYSSILEYCIEVKEYKSYNFIIYKFYEILKDLDNNNKISNGLLFYILDIFDNVGTKIIDKKEDTLLSKFLNDFSHLPDKITLIHSKKEYKEKIIDIIFYFGVNSIENKNIQALKTCSNQLGWYAKSLFDSGDNIYFKKTINYAVQMYNLADEEGVDNSTKSFLGTFFIILGAYTYKKSNQKINIKNYIDNLNDKEPLKVSKRLREYRHKHWDDIFDGKSKTAINNFFKKLNIQ